MSDSKSSSRKKTPSPRPSRQYEEGAAKNTAATMSIAFHNKGKSVIKIGDVVILPDTSYNFEGDAFKEICSNPMDIESTSLLMHNMAAAQEKNKKKELTKEEKVALRSNFTYDPWHKKPCCIVPPCAHCVVCIDCCIRPPIPGAGLICKVPQLLCGFFTKPCCVYHCKCCEFPTCGCSGLKCISCPSCACLKCISCPSCACPSCPCGLPVCTICPPTCLWCGIKCPPSCPKCCPVCTIFPPSCTCCEITCPPLCCVDLCGFKTVGFCVPCLCHCTCFGYPKCCPACIICTDETIIKPNNNLIVTGKKETVLAALANEPTVGTEEMNRK